MIKPCLDDHGDYQEGCLTCKLWRDDPRYAAAIDLLDKSPDAKKRKYIQLPLAITRAPVDPQQIKPPCKYRGAATGEEATCPTCTGGGVQVKLFSCATYGDCTIAKKVDNHACCRSCVTRVEPTNDS